MRDRTIGIVLGILNILLIAVCLVLYLGKDRTAPELTLQEAEYVYEEDLPEHILLEGVTAWDEREGDVTDRVVVEKIVTDTVKKAATITYGVADSEGNVQRVSRTLEMPIPERPQLPTAGEAGNTGISIEPETEEAGQNSEAAEGNTAAEAETTQETETGETTIQNAGSETGDGRPVIVFTSRELTIKTGEQPDWISVMGEVQDDKDAKETLLGTLEIKGEYDLEKTGEYYLTLSITDSDGNVSNAYPMKLMVEE